MKSSGFCHSRLSHPQPRFADLLRCRLHRLPRGLLGTLEFLVGIEGLAAAAPEQRHFGADPPELRLGQPRMRVDATRRQFQQAFVGALAGGILGETRELAQIGQRAHHVGIAQPPEQAGGFRLRACVFVGRERRAPTTAWYANAPVRCLPA